MELYYFSILPTRCKSVRQSSLYSKTMVVIVGLSAPTYSISVTMHPYNFPGTTACDACAPTLKHLPAAKTLSIYIACTHTHHFCELACGCANWLPRPIRYPPLEHTRPEREATQAVPSHPNAVTPVHCDAVAIYALPSKRNN
jgi:hypothetical protein